MCDVNLAYLTGMPVHAYIVQHIQFITCISMYCGVRVCTYSTYNAYMPASTYYYMLAM